MSICELCPKPIYENHSYFCGIKNAHVKCKEKLEKEHEILCRQTNLQRVKHNQELRVYQIQRLLINDFYIKNRQANKER